MKHQYLIYIFLSLILFSCKEDKEIYVEKSKNQQVEDIKSLLLDKVEEKVIDSVNFDKTEIESELISKNKEVSKEISEKKKVLKIKKEQVLNEKILNSKYKDMNCVQLISKYKSVLLELEKTGNEELILWKDSNDPIFKFCYEKNKIVFDSLERVENEIGEKLFEM